MKKANERSALKICLSAEREGSVVCLPEKYRSRFKWASSSTCHTKKTNASKSGNVYNPRGSAAACYFYSWNNSKLEKIILADTKQLLPHSLDPVINNKKERTFELLKTNGSFVFVPLPHLNARAIIAKQKSNVIMHNNIGPPYSPHRPCSCCATPLNVFLSTVSKCLVSCFSKYVCITLTHTQTERYSKSFSVVSFVWCAVGAM